MKKYCNFIWVIIPVFLISCNKELGFLGGDKDYAILLQYEEEHVVLHQWPGKTSKDLTGAQMALEMPVVNRQKITIGINEDGSSEWDIVEMEPKNPFNAPIECPADHSRKVARTRMVNNKVYQYDEKGILLQSIDMRQPDFSGLIAAVKLNGNKLNRYIYSRHFNQYANLPNTKDEITEVQPGLSLYTHTINNGDTVGPEWIGKKIVCYLETATLCPLANFVLDENDQVISRRITK